MRSQDSIAWLPCLVDLFRRAVTDELITAPFLEGESTVYWAWEESFPGNTSCQRRHGILHGFCSALPGQSHLPAAGGR